MYFYTFLTNYVSLPFHHQDYTCPNCRSGFIEELSGEQLPSSAGGGGGGGNILDDTYVVWPTDAHLSPICLDLFGFVWPTVAEMMFGLPSSFSCLAYCFPNV